MTPRIYTAQELNLTLYRDFPSGHSPEFLNNNYCAVTKEWVEDRFAPYIFLVEKARGQQKYQRRGNQCEHFAIRAAMEAVNLFRIMADDSTPAEVESIAVSVIKYLRGAGTSAAFMHMVDAWYINGYWREWEPQSRTWFTMTDAERKTARPLMIF